MDTALYLTALRELAQQGKSVSVTVSGESMRPFLTGGRDRVIFRAPERPLRRGDVVFYTRPNGQFVMHRIAHVNGDGSYDLIGDAQTSLEQHVPATRIFALVTQVIRDGRPLSVHAPVCWFFRTVWLCLPLRRRLLSLRAALRR